MTIYRCDLTNFSNLSPTLRGGDTVLITSGIYKDYKWTISCNGASTTSRIYIKAEMPGSLIFTGQSTLVVNGSFTTVANMAYTAGMINKAIKVMGNNNRLTGFDVSYDGLDIEYIMGIDGLANRVDHCIFHDWRYIGVWLAVIRTTAAENFAIIDHNIFRNRTATNANNGLECIRIGDSAQSLSSAKCVIEQNLIENCNGEIECISNKCCDNIYYKNTLTNSEGTITLRHGNRCHVYKNKFLQNNKPNSGGVRITGESHIVARNMMKDIKGNGTTRCGISVNNGMPSTPINGYYTACNVKIIDNVFINNSHDLAVGVEVKTGNLLLPVNLVVKNNVIYKNTDNGLVFSQDPSVKGATSYTVSNNIIYASSNTVGRNHFPSGFTVQPAVSYTQLYGESYYGYDETIGTMWTTDPVTTNIALTNQQYYYQLRDRINAELASLDGVTPPTPPPPPAGSNDSIAGKGGGFNMPTASARLTAEAMATLVIDQYNDSMPGVVTLKFVNNNSTATKINYRKIQFAVKGYMTDLTYPVISGTATQASRGTSAVTILYNGTPVTANIWSDSTKARSGLYVLEFTLTTGYFNPNDVITLRINPSATKETSILSLLSYNDATGVISTFYQRNLHYQFYDLPNHAYTMMYYLPKPQYTVITTSTSNTIPTDSNVVRPPIDIGSNTSNIVIPPSNIVIPPSNIIIPPSNIVIPPSNIVIPPSNIVIPPSNIVIPPSNTVTPSNRWFPGSKNKLPPPSNVPSDDPMYNFTDTGRPPITFLGIGDSGGSTSGGKDNTLLYLVISGIIVAVVTKNIS